MWRLKHDRTNTYHCAMKAVFETEMAEKRKYNFLDIKAAFAGVLPEKVVVQVYKILPASGVFPVLRRVTIPYNQLALREVPELFIDAYRIWHMQAARNLKNKNQTIVLNEFANKLVHAVAGIGNPHRFFRQLEKHGIQVIEHPFKDHYPYSINDISFDDELPVLMTEKDAVKCLSFAQDKHWVIPVTAKVNNKFLENLTEQVRTYNG